MVRMPAPLAPPWAILGRSEGHGAVTDIPANRNDPKIAVLEKKWNRNYHPRLRFGRSRTLSFFQYSDLESALRRARMEYAAWTFAP